MDADRKEVLWQWRRTDCNGINKQMGVGTPSASILSFSVCSVHMMYVHLCMFAFVFEFACTRAMWRAPLGGTCMPPHT